MAGIFPKGKTLEQAKQVLPFDEYVTRALAELEAEEAAKARWKARWKAEIAAKGKPDSLPLGPPWLRPEVLDVAPVLDDVRGAILISGRAPIALGETEELVVWWLVKLKAATLTELRDNTGCASPNKVIKKILTKYPELAPWLKLPGKKGRGGYSTLIQLKPAG